LTVATAEIEDAFARVCGKPLEYAASQFMDERTVAAIRFRVPGLWHARPPVRVSLELRTSLRRDEPCIDNG
jgi:hypothetical protein